MWKLLPAVPDLQPASERRREALNDYYCFGCNGYIIEGQPVVLTTRVLSVQYQRLDESKIYHERCYPAVKTDEDAVRVCTGCGTCAYCKTFPVGLCGNRADHAPHLHDSTSLGRMWCEADQAKRLPFAMERCAAP